ncbi:helix-turn-helix transcriptional regulator [Symbiopectobacterium purcellii]|uniref:Helix-turn-helix transcriptional regulator n=1 Tax=Symbiopectobacterium purcellii TaxID=2871826 RepID=A0ABX9AKI5_9ENTR|nr:helix-turn-helix transcriptional regulator [Symbiopectobacterium purcellii]QZN94230.1 helix-turn-helix transcriptional regulator [Symbiopectobacterium purcellii]
MLKSLNNDNYQITSAGIGLVTEKELEVVWLLIHGYSPKEVSRILNLSTRTVNHSVHSVFDKIDIHNIAQLRAIYVDQDMDNFIPAAILKMGVYNL